MKGHTEYWEKGTESEGSMEKNENHACAFQFWLLCHYVPCSCKKGMYLYTGFRSEEIVTFRADQIDKWLQFQGLLRLNMKLLNSTVNSSIGVSDWVNPAGIPLVLLGQFIQVTSCCSNWISPTTVQHVIQCHNIFFELI